MKKEIVNLTVPQKGFRKTLLLTSYCGTQDEKCSSNKPCLDCISMCNCFEIPNETIDNGRFLGTLDYLKP